MSSSSNTGEPSHLRPVRDLRRLAVGSVEAAKRLGVPRPKIRELIEAGELDGYGIPSEHRTRWFVYEDSIVDALAVDADLPDTQQVFADDVLSLAKNLVEAIRAERQARLDSAEDARHALGLYAEAMVAIRSTASPELREYLSDNVDDLTDEAGDAERRTHGHEISAQRRADEVNRRLDHVLAQLQEIGGRDDVSARGAG